MMHKLTENIGVDVALKPGVYATTAAANAAALEVDIEDAQNAILYVYAGVVGDGENKPVTVTLQGADASGGDFADLTADDGETATVTLTEAGDGKVEIRAEELKRYLQVNVENLDDTGDADAFTAFIVSGNYGTLPVE